MFRMRTTSGLLAACATAIISHAVAAQSNVIPAGTAISIRTTTDIDSRNADLTKEYQAVVDEPVVVNGTTLAPVGETVWLRIVDTRQAGAVSGRASLTLKLVGVNVNKQRVAVETGQLVSESKSQGGQTAKKTGIGAAVGGIGGAIIGGGQGAAIGAVVGGGVGATVAMTNAERVQVKKESRLTFTLAEPASLDGAPAVTTSAPSPAPAPAAAAASAAPVPITQGRISTVDLTFVDAVATGKILTVTMSVLNSGNDAKMHIGYSCTAIQIIDDEGGTHRSSQVVVGNVTTSGGRWVDIVNDVPVKVTATFNDLVTRGGNPTIKEIKRLLAPAFVTQNTNLNCNSNPTGRVEMRNLPVKTE